jgi:ATP adenylyltransferase
MNDKLWAPWRMDYIKSPKQEGCVFCIKSKLENEKENLVLYRGQESYVLMNLYPYSNCHILIAPYAHTADTNEIKNTGNQEIMWLANKSMNILRKTTGAEGFNFGANIGKAAGAGIEEHLHYHIVPRWTGDTNFMPVVGNTKVIVQGLTDSWEKLRPHFDTLGKA